MHGITCQPRDGCTYLQQIHSATSKGHVQNDLLQSRAHTKSLFSFAVSPERLEW
jgi:hypothetical protein